MAMTAEGHRFLRKVHQGKVPWHWTALCIGKAQPLRFVWVDRRRWRFHLTPIHLERWDGTVEIGLCFGRRTIYLLHHR